MRITCRDLPELSLSAPHAEGLLNHLEAAEAALDAMVNEYISQGRALPSPSHRESGERLLAPTPGTIVRAVRHQSL